MKVPVAVTKFKDGRIANVSLLFDYDPPNPKRSVRDRLFFHSDEELVGIYEVVLPEKNMRNMSQLFQAIIDLDRTLQYHNFSWNLFAKFFEAGFQAGIQAKESEVIVAVPSSKRKMQCE